MHDLRYPKRCAKYQDGPRLIQYYRLEEEHDEADEVELEIEPAQLVTQKLTVI